MTAVTVVTDKMALTLVERHGRSSMIYVDEHVKDALKGGDWSRVKAWRGVGSEIERLLSPRLSLSLMRPTRADGAGMAGQPVSN